MGLRQKMAANLRNVRISQLYALLFGLTIQLPQLLALSFTAEPQSLDAYEGRTVTLPCSVDEKDVTFSWTLDAQEVDNLPGISIQDGNLVISPVDRNSHAGEFRCVVNSANAEGPMTSQSASLNILWISGTAKLTLKTPGDPDSISENDRVTMSCKADGFDEPDYTFYRDATELQHGGNIDINDNRLRILAVHTSDNGVYSCKASNRAGEVWSTRGNVTIGILGSDYPTVVIQPEDQMVFEGDAAYFHCQFSGTPPPPIEWYIGEDDGGILYNMTGTSIFPNGTLALQNIQVLDEGTYTCRCKSEFGEPFVSAELQVARVEPLPPFEPVIVKEGDQLTKRCQYEPGPGGIPTPTLLWSKPGSTLSTNEGDRVHVSSGYLLVIDSIEKADEGNYTCTASNTAGEVTSHLRLTVATKPVFTISPTDVVVREQETAILDCQAEADPEPSIKWYWNDVMMGESQFIRVMDNGTLVFYNPSPQNSGTYACVASNIVGSLSKAEAELTVQAILKFNPKPVTSTQFELGAQEKLNCHAVAESTPTVTWMKGGEAISDDHIIADNSMLLFNGSVKSDAGSYTCIARTDGEEINATIKVEVFVKPKFTIVPVNVTVEEGESVMLNCEAFGDPHPEINWIKENDKHQLSKLENNSLFLEDLSLGDGGKYTCVAGSPGGLNTSDVFITVERGIIAPPGASPEVMTRTFAIAVGCAIAYILLFIFLMIWCKQRRRKRRLTLKEEGASKEEGGPLGNGLGEYHDEEANKGGIPLTAAAVQATRANYDKLQFPRHDLETIAVIGHGAYGEVSIRRAQGIRDGEDATTVLVKALETKDDNLHLNFRSEIDMLNKLNHDNIVKLLGICKEQEPQLMITEYLDWGDLKQFLRATRGEDKGPNNPPPLTYNQKVDIIGQVALGMEHLSNNRFVHADLAARNCLLSPSMEVKVCTMSASKDLYRAEYHEHQQRLMPVRWMPPEAIFEDELSTKSDIWAFGVFVWEVFSQGELPYGDMDDDAYMSAIADGEDSTATLKTPGGTPEEVETTMQRCWAASIKDRPSFSELVLAMQQLNSDSTI